MPQEQSERRHFTRIAIDCRAVLHCGASTWETHLLDVSLKGALLKRPENFARPEGECSLQLYLEPSQNVIQMSGQIVHQETDTLGFYCHHIDLDSIAHLKRMLELNLGDEQLLERELGELLLPH